MTSEVVDEIVEHEFPSEKKEEWWGKGDWVQEPDKVFFKYRGYQCLILRIASQENGFSTPYGGHLCGYVVIPKGDPHYEKTYLELEKEGEFVPDVHGGITYSEKGVAGLYEEEWVIGFDCAHYKDLVPSFLAIKQEVRERLTKVLEKIGYDRGYIEKTFISKDVYRNIHFVKKEIINLVDQLKENHGRD